MDPVLLQTIRIVCDAVGQPESASVVYETRSGRQQVEPVPVGPFDTIDDVTRRLQERLTLQGTLW